MLYVETKTLPETIKSVLSSLGYNKSDITVEVKESACLSSSSYNKGNRGVCCVVNMTTGENKVVYGSWGGQNPFEHNAVDYDEEQYKIPENCAVIKGESGGVGVFLNVIISPQNTNKFLPEKVELSDKEYKCLYAFHSLKSAYRKEELARYDIGNDIVDKLIEQGYLDRNKVGTKITTKGKNVVSSKRGY
jgi:hypothetical protein